MLNISKNSISESIILDEFKSGSLLRKTKVRPLVVWFIVVLLVLAIACMFLPWTQNIQAKGYVTTRSPEQRPNAIQSVISGKLERWYVQEGDLVEEGDTIVFISEVKSEYFDPDLIERTTEQVNAKAQSVASYEGKIKALEKQYKALEEGMQLKLAQTKNKIAQAKNKVRIDSMDLVAYRANLSIAENQLERIQELHNKGLKSLTDLQEKELKTQEALAKVTVQENKLINQKNELGNLYIELSAVEREYSDKLAKSQSDQQSALSDKLESMANTAKLQNQLSNYNQRQQFYYITAPQSGYITKAVKKGIGEIIKEGSDIATIMPTKYDLAVETYIKPQDLPLIQKGGEVRLRFDGWPAIIISGWPDASTGIFTGEIIAIDQFIGENGYYRIMLGPNAKYGKKWPEQLRVGTGANTFMVLQDVPLWYELWRQLNGFPPDFYKKENSEEKNKEIKFKAPIKNIK